DDSITVLVDRSELGQGVSTSLPMLVAEELGADWSKIRFEFAPADPAYFNPMIHAQGTGGSTSIRAAWKPLRQAGAAARVMLIESGVAVVADTTWQALRGRDALAVTWSEGANASVSDETIRKSYLELAETPGAVTRNDGDADQALAQAAQRVEAQYEVPFM